MRTSNRLTNARLNIMSGMINKVLGLLFPFIIRTILLKKLGSEYLGLSSLFSSILQVLSLADLGLGSAIVFSMYRPLAEGKRNEVRALMNYYKVIYQKIGTVILILGLVLVPFLPSLIHSSYPKDVNLYILYMIYLLNTVMSYYLFAYKQALLISTQRSDIDNNILSVVNTAMYVIQIVVLILFRNYYVYIIFLPISTLFINLLRKRIVDKKYPQYLPNGNISNSVKKDLFKRITGVMLYKISYISRNSFDSIFISAFIGLTALADYQNYYYVLNGVVAFLIVITSSITAGVGNSMVTESREKNYADLNKFTFIFNWVLCICVSAFLCMYQSFMKIWVGNEHMLPFVIVVLLCLYFYSTEIGTISSVYREAAGIWWYDRYRPIVESIVNLAINFLLVRQLGIAGVLISTIISIIFINIPWATYVLFKIYFKLNPFHFFISLLRYAVVTLVISIITYGVFSITIMNISSSVLILLIGSVCAIIIPNLLLLLCYRKSKFFSSMISMFKRMI